MDHPLKSLIKAAQDLPAALKAIRRVGNLSNSLYTRVENEYNEPYIILNKDIVEQLAKKEKIRSLNGKVRSRRKPR